MILKGASIEVEIEQARTDLVLGKPVDVEGLLDLFEKEIADIRADKEDMERERDSFAREAEEAEDYNRTLIDFREEARRVIRGAVQDLDALELGLRGDKKKNLYAIVDRLRSLMEE